MVTTVYKEILDDSISGDKLAYGIVNPPFARMDADQVLIGKASTSQSLIDNVIIGSRYDVGGSYGGADGYFKYLEVQNRDNSSSVFEVKSRNATGIDILLQAYDGYGGVIRASSSAGVVGASINGYTFSYLMHELVIGASSKAVPNALLQVIGNAWISDILDVGIQISCPVGSFPTTLYTTINGFLDSVGDNLTTLLNIVSGFTDPLTVAELQKLTNTEVKQLENINSVTISNAQWVKVGAMQGVAITDNLQFASIAIGGAASENKITYTKFYNGTANLCRYTFGDGSVAGTLYFKYSIISNKIVLQSMSDVSITPGADDLFYISLASLTANIYSGITVSNILSFSFSSDIPMTIGGSALPYYCGGLLPIKTGTTIPIAGVPSTQTGLLFFAPPSYGSGLVFKNGITYTILKGFNYQSLI